MRIFLLTICLFISTMLCAQNNVLTEIEKANAAYTELRRVPELSATQYPA